MALVVKNLPANAGDMREMGYYQPLGRPLEGGMAAGSRILAWRIPWTGESGRLQPVELQRAGHDLSDLEPTYARHG